MRRLTKLAVLVAVAAVAADTFGDVTGFTTFTCSDEIAYRYDSVADACADHGIRAYMDWDEGIFPECRICDDDGGGNSPGPPPGEIIIIPPICPEGKHLHGGVCHADHVCGDGEIGGGGEDCEPCGEGSVPNNIIHAGDFIGYDSCAPWYTSGGVRDIKRAGYTESDINENGFEKWTVERADDEYEATFGVLSPYDPFHNATADNKPLPCLFY